MSKSKFFGPGAYEELNGTTVHLTSDSEKPSFSATAYATALSKPLPFVGSSSSKYGGNAGLSVPTVSRPSVLSSSEDLSQLAAAAVGVAEAEPEPEGSSSSPHPAATRDRASRESMERWRMRMGTHEPIVERFGVQSTRHRARARGERAARGANGGTTSCRGWRAHPYCTGTSSGRPPPGACGLARTRSRRR